MQRSPSVSGLGPGPNGVGVVENGKWYIARQLTDYVDGVCYSDLVPRIKAMKRAQDLAGAEALLLRICDAMEAGEAAVAPWYYEQLAIMYRKQHRHEDELVVLRRYERQKKAPGARRAALEERLQSVVEKRPS